MISLTTERPRASDIIKHILQLSMTSKTLNALYELICHSNLNKQSQIECKICRFRKSFFIWQKPPQISFIKQSMLTDIFYNNLAINWRQVIEMLRYKCQNAPDPYGAEQQQHQSTRDTVFPKRCTAVIEPRQPTIVRLKIKLTG